MKRLPIRIRVAAAFALAMAAVLAGSGWFLYARVGSHLELALNRELELRAQDLTTVVEQRHLSLAQRGSGRFIEHGESFAQLLDPQGHVLDATRPLGTTSLLHRSELHDAFQEPIFTNRSSVPGLDEPARLLATPVSLNGRKGVLVVGATRQDRAETLASFRKELLIAGPVALLVASFVGYLLAGLSLREVESMRRRAAAISAETPGERLPVPRTGDELQRLGATLNEMLDRLEDALERERDFVADAGHELRTPLALLRTELELALRHTGSVDELRATLQVASQEVDRLSQLAEDLLLLARVERGRLPLQLETLDADALVNRVATRFEWRAETERRPLLVDAHPGTRLVGDRLRLEQALSNLVDNALRHGRGAVRLGVEDTATTVQLHVEDEGPGFPACFLERAFERFSRSHAGHDGSGTGLGLAIVQSIAEAHGGAAHARNRSGGGADVWLELAAARENEAGPAQVGRPVLRRSLSR